MKWIMLLLLLIATNALFAQIKSLKEPVLGMTFIQVKAGSFTMGTEDEKDSKAHKVTITKDYLLSNCEITLEQWQKIMGTKELHPDKPNPFRADHIHYPVVSISYNDIQEFLEKLNKQSAVYTFRLPTEAEWEYACRAGTVTRYNFGDTISDKQANYNAQIPFAYSLVGKKIDHPVAVGSYAPNAWGFYDMHGNVWEWVNDWYAPYSSDESIDPEGPDRAQLKVIRGGSFYFGASNATSAHRRTHDPATWGFSIGFRLVCEPVKE